MLWEQATYYSCADRTGSSSFITDANGEAYQFLQYLPFGESFISQRLDEWQARYTFSAKEKDEATGYHYFGARYYDSETSVWLSVDPLADRFPDLSPYAYVYNNPLNYNDAWGLWGDKTKAEKQRTKDVERYGKDRVGVVRKSSKTDEWGYTVYHDEEDKTQVVRDENEKLVVTENGLFVDSRRKSYKYTYNSKNDYSLTDRITFSENRIRNFMISDPTNLGQIDVSEGSTAHRVCQAGVNLMPIVTGANIYKVFLGDGKDIHGNKADNQDKALLILGVGNSLGKGFIKVIPISKTAKPTSKALSKSLKEVSNTTGEINEGVINTTETIKTIYGKQE
ncbi:MAG: RHS repeat domain-containing protein [bacterium]